MQIFLKNKYDTLKFILLLYLYRFNLITTTLGISEPDEQSTTNI